MSKYYSALLIFILSILMYMQPAYTQMLSDSVFLEQAFQDKNKVAVDSMLNSWYSQSVNKKHENLEDDATGFVYKVYTQFMKDYIHKKMAGRLGIPINANYFFVQDNIHYLFIDSLSFEDLHYYFNGIFQHYGLLSYRDSISTYIRKIIAKNYKEGTLETIESFYPDLKNIFYNKYDPKPIYIKENNRLKTLIHFLGYETLRPGLTTYRTTNIIQLKERRKFLNSVLGFDYIGMSEDQFLTNFEYGFTPEVLNILVDSDMRYAMVEYFIGRTGGVYIAFYPLKLINSDNGGTPLSWHFLSY